MTVFMILLYLSIGVVVSTIAGRILFDERYDGGEVVWWGLLMASAWPVVLVMGFIWTILLLLYKQIHKKGGRRNEH